MDKKKVIHITDDLFRKLKKRFNQVIPGFDLEAIHQFRVEYKKLRAFLRMLSRQGKPGKISITGRLKRMYRCAGSLRDLQFLEQRLQVDLKQPGKELPDCIGIIQQEMDTLKTQFSGPADGKIIKEARKKVVKALPGNSYKNLFKIFAEKKRTEINALMSSQTFSDTQVHSIRKGLKDLFYNLQLFKETGTPAFPVNKWNKEKMKWIEQLLVDLGGFQDSCTAIDLLERHCAADRNSKAGIKIKQLDKKWKLEKRRSKRLLVNKLKQLASL